LNFHDSELLPGGREDYAHFPCANLPIDADILELDSESDFGALPPRSIGGRPGFFSGSVLDRRASIRLSSLTGGSFFNHRSDDGRLAGSATISVS